MPTTWLRSWWGVRSEPEVLRGGDRDSLDQVSFIAWRDGRIEVGQRQRRHRPDGESVREVVPDVGLATRVARGPEVGEHVIKRAVGEPGAVEGDFMLWDPGVGNLDQFHLS